MCIDSFGVCIEPIYAPLCLCGVVTMNHSFYQHDSLDGTRNLSQMKAPYNFPQIPAGSFTIACLTETNVCGM